ncbi:N-acetylmuramoyl-L-alanine amidase, partial [Octadecabacter sp.]|nr:N-acetylmuramoyl-L-alanine amidase [Octadecabacter sp.]
APLMDALCDLLPHMMDRWAVPAERVIGHSDLAPGRKIDPGARFDWTRLARGGMAIEARPQAAAAADRSGFLRDLAAIGYNADVDENVLLSAFRLRHRQGFDGPLDGWDCAIAADLARRFPIAKHRLTS